MHCSRYKRLNFSFNTFSVEVKNRSHPFPHFYYFSQSDCSLDEKQFSSTFNSSNLIWRLQETFLKVLVSLTIVRIENVKALVSTNWKWWVKDSSRWVAKISGPGHVYIILYILWSPTLLHITKGEQVRYLILIRLN